MNSGVTNAEKSLNNWSLLQTGKPALNARSAAIQIPAGFSLHFPVDPRETDSPRPAPLPARADSPEPEPRVAVGCAFLSQKRERTFGPRIF